MTPARALIELEILRRETEEVLRVLASRGGAVANAVAAANGARRLTALASAMDAMRSERNDATRSSRSELEGE